MDGYHKTNIPWLNATPLFIIRQNHGGKAQHGLLLQNKYIMVECDTAIYRETKSRAEGTPWAVIPWLNATSPFIIRQNHGVRHTMGNYHRTNIPWLNATSPFIVRQNHGVRYTMDGYYRTNIPWLNAASPFIIRQNHGVRHNIGNYYRTNIPWLNATSPFIVRQNLGLWGTPSMLSQIKIAYRGCNIMIRYPTIMWQTLRRH